MLLLQVLFKFIISKSFPLGLSFDLSLILAYWANDKAISRCHACAYHLLPVT